jgi:hypothetical protein
MAWVIMSSPGPVVPDFLPRVKPWAEHGAGGGQSPLLEECANITQQKFLRTSQQNLCE